MQPHFLGLHAIGQVGLQRPHRAAPTHPGAYADAGVQEIESIQVLKLKPFDSMGTLPEIIKSGFGDRNGYNQAISELESEIYHLPPRSA